MADDKKKQEVSVPVIQHFTPQGYTSPYQEKIDTILHQYQNREPFQFNVNEDALYNQYKDQYIKHGKLAMEDTMGQAAALTGGYGNSYAQTVGQQVYQGYLDDLNDVVPDLWQQALDRYQKEGSDMLTEYGLLSDLENQEYSRFQDAAALARSQVDNMISMGIMPESDLIKMAGYSQSYAQQMVSKVQAQMAMAYSGGGGSSGGSSGGGGRRKSSGSGGGYGSGYQDALTLVTNAAKATGQGGQESIIQHAYDTGQITQSGAKELAKLVGNTKYTKK